MKFSYKAGEEMPSSPGVTYKAFTVEPVNGGYWCHDRDRRSAGKRPDTPLSETLKWILQQMSYGHLEELNDLNGDIVGLKLGQDVPYEVPDSKSAGEEAGFRKFGLNMAAIIAEARERGTTLKNLKFEQTVWANDQGGLRIGIEMHYGLLLCELLGRVSKKLPKLELLPIMEHAPEATRDYLAEATRCYLFKLDRACIALCRACLEDTLRSLLTEDMKVDWENEMESNKRKFRNPKPMLTLIAVCARHGVLDKSHAKAADDIREEANDVLHLDKRRKVKKAQDVAGEVLKKTRGLIGFIYGNLNMNGT